MHTFKTILAAVGLLLSGAVSAQAWEPGGYSSDPYSQSYDSSAGQSKSDYYRQQDEYRVRQQNEETLRSYEDSTRRYNSTPSWTDNTTTIVGPNGRVTTCTQDSPNVIRCYGGGR